MSTTTTLIGNATADPDLRFFESGTAKATFSIAVNRYWKDDSGEKKEQTSYFNVHAWGYLAEDVARVVSKGARVIVTGRLEQQTWEDKTSGDKKSQVVVIADQIGIGLISIESFERRTGGGTGVAETKTSTSSRQAPQRGSAPRQPTRTAPRQPQFEDEEAF